MINPALVIQEVESLYYLKPGNITSTKRFKTVSDARATAQYLMRDLCNLSYPEIASYFDCDHTSVVHNCKKIEKITSDATNSHTKRVIFALDANYFREVI